MHALFSTKRRRKLAVNRSKWGFLVQYQGERIFEKSGSLRFNPLFGWTHIRFVLHQQCFGHADPPGEHSFVCRHIYDQP